MLNKNKQEFKFIGNNIILIFILLFCNRNITKIVNEIKKEYNKFDNV